MILTPTSFLRLHAARKWAGRGSRGGGFPAVATGTLILRLMGENITGVADGDPVALWPDSSSLAHGATSASAPEQPEFCASSATFNGQPTVLFDGVDDGMLVHDGCVLETPYTLFLVAAALHGAAGNGRYLQSQDGNHKLSFNTTDYSAYSAPDIIQNDSTAVPGASPALACLVSGEVLYSYFVNAESPYTNNALGDWGRLSLNGAGMFGQHIAQETAAVIVYSGALSDSDRLKVSAHLDTLYFGGSLGFA